jgi:hypothetical protein
VSHFSAWPVVVATSPIFKPPLYFNSNSSCNFGPAAWNREADTSLPFVEEREMEVVLTIAFTYNVIHEKMLYVYHLNSTCNTRLLLNQMIAYPAVVGTNQSYNNLKVVVEIFDTILF